MKIKVKVIILVCLLNSSLSWDYVQAALSEFSPGKSGGTNKNTFPKVARLSTDYYVISWTATISSTTSDIYFSIYDAKATMIKTPTKANDTSNLNSRNLTAGDKDSGFVLVWK